MKKPSQISANLSSFSSQFTFLFNRANYLTDYFHLFVCLAIISAYADDVIAQDLKSDEMLLYFSSLGKCVSD